MERFGIIYGTVWHQIRNGLASDTERFCVEYRTV